MGADQFLWRQHSRQNGDRNTDGCQNVFILRVLELKLDRVRSWLTASFRFDIEPEGLPLPRLHPQRRQRIIPLLIPLALRGVTYKPIGASALLRRNLFIYGLGGVIVPFVGIKLIDMLVSVFF